MEHLQEQIIKILLVLLTLLCTPAFAAITLSDGRVIECVGCVGTLQEIQPDPDPDPEPPTGSTGAYPVISGTPAENGPYSCGTYPHQTTLHSTDAVIQAHFGQTSFSQIVNHHSYCIRGVDFNGSGGWQGQDYPNRVTYTGPGGGTSNDMDLVFLDSVQTLEVNLENSWVNFIDGATMETLTCLPGSNRVDVYQNGVLTHTCP